MELGTFIFSTGTMQMTTPMSRVIYVPKGRWGKAHWGAKDPSDVEDWELNFGALLGRNSLILNATVKVDGATLTSFDTLPQAVRVWLSGGQAGTDIVVEITVTSNTAPARTFQRSFILEVLEL